VKVNNFALFAVEIGEGGTLMKQVGPLLTLLAGGVLAAGIGGLSARAASQGSPANGEYGAARKASTPAPTGVAPSAAAPGSAATGRTTAGNGTAPSTSLTQLKRDYAGYTRGGAATLAIAVRGNRAIAYLCDGSVLESWFRGSVTNGQFELSGKSGAHLTGMDKSGTVTGSARVPGHSFGFTVVRVKRPSGLYRLTAEVRGARLDGGWIVLPGGRQVGLLYSNGVSRPAPALDLASNSVNVNGQRVPAQEATP
jgi:hypothetical protein